MRILIAEDDAITRRLLQAALIKAGYDVVAVNDGTAAWWALQAPDAPRLVVLDWMMPGMDGPEICREVRKRQGQPYVYILLLTARDGKQDTIAGLEAGADDYLVKPFDAFELRARLNVGKRILELQTQLVSAYEEMRHRAHHDALTGVLNRGAILDSMEREWARAQREGHTLGVLMADLDHFKRINDTHGHPAGDAVLREAARRMTSVLRTYDYLGRYGGEEFLILLPRCNESALVSLAERLRESISVSAVAYGGASIPVTVSIGVTLGEEQSSTDAAQLRQAADAALYRAKQGGRNRIVVNTPAEFALAAVSA
jgi:diguanylate cyclase (GGDEF)-like protein